jgi:hypothetical protein
MFFLTAPFRGRRVTFQDESAVREQGTSQVVKKEAEKLKVHLPFRIDSFESELRWLFGLLSIRRSNVRWEGGQMFFVCQSCRCRSNIQSLWALAAWERPFNKGLQAIDRGNAVALSISKRLKGWMTSNGCQ